MRKLESQRAYTLIEIVIAIMIMTVGALTLAAGAATVARSMAANGLRERASRVASSRLEQLRASCRTATSGSEISNGIRSTWTVTPDSALLGVVVSASYPTSGGTRTETYRATMACEP